MTRPDDLAAIVLRALVERTGVDPASIEDVLMGCAYPEGSPVTECLLPKEAGVAILIDQGHEILDRPDLVRGFIAMPLEIAALPEDSPHVPAADVRRLGYRRLMTLVGEAAPHRTDFEDLDALPRYPETEV
jgi:hypothetical protein